MRFWLLMALGAIATVAYYAAASTATNGLLVTAIYVFGMFVLVVLDIHWLNARQRFTGRQR